MTTSDRSWGFWLAGASWLAVGYAIANSEDCAHAQITPDTTLGAENSVVTPTNINGLPTERIDGGAVRGTNLFHSFEQFSVPTGSAAYFNNAASIQNIISRVTGGSISNIDGLIRANGAANLFLLNPNGIVFGPNARLDIGGSFVASTASSLNFADGTEFSATAPQTTPLLTVSVPLGLQFGGNAGSIQVQGNGQEIRTTTDLIDTTVGLRVQPGRTLALVGGDLALKGGTLKTAGGRIELGSVASPSLVSLTPINTGWALGYEKVPTFGEIHLSSAAAVDASGAGGGDAQVRSRRVTLTNGSQIKASTLGAEPGGKLTVTASESMELIGVSADGQFPSALAAQVYPGATGAGGNLTLETGRLSVRDGAVVSTATFGAGAAGTLSVNASNLVEVIGESANGQWISGLSTEVSPGVTGAGGNLNLKTGRLSVRDGALVSTATYGAGAGGNLTVTASELVEAFGTTANGQLVSGLFTSVESGATGAGGNLTLETGRLIVKDGAQIQAATFGEGAAGTLAVRASESVELMGTSAFDSRIASGLLTLVEPGATGSGGNLTLETGRLIVRDGAQIIASGALSEGGSLAVRAFDLVELSGTTANGQLRSGLINSVEGDGDAKDLTIQTGRLIVKDGAEVRTSSFGAGKSGNLTVTASESVELRGTGTSANGQSASGLFSRSFGTGDAGNLTISTQQLIVQGGARASASTFLAQGGILSVTAKQSVKVIGNSADGEINSGLFAQTVGPGDAGDLRIETGQLIVRDRAELRVSATDLGFGEPLGAAGNIEVAARNLLLENLGVINATTVSGNGGNITLQAQDLILMRRGGEISTTAGLASTGGNGGNIDINSDFIVAVPGENSDITANAFRGNGGRVQITASGIFGLEPRSRQQLQTLLETDNPSQLDPSRLPSNDITAISQTNPSLSGQVTLNIPDVDPAQGLAVLPTQPTEPEVVQACQPGGSQQQSEFVVTGRGGLPPTPREALGIDIAELDWVTLNPKVDNRSRAVASTNPTRDTPARIIEAQGWIIGENGEVILTANTPTVTHQSSWQSPIDCHAAQ